MFAFRRSATSIACRCCTTAAKNQHSVRVIRPSADEISSGNLSQRHLQASLEALHSDGLVLLEGVIPHEALDKLNTRMLQDTKVLQAMGDKGPFNYNPYNIQQDPPLDSSTFNANIFLNPLATNITSAFLGGRPKLSFVSGNTAIQDMQGSGQPVHSDADFEHPKIPFACVVNIGLVDMEPENGSTELWLGTHTDSGLHAQEGAHGERASGRIQPELLKARAEVSPPFQPVVSKGSLVIRDLRLWHAGRPNRTSAPRVMLAFIHMAPWYRQRMAVALPTPLKSVMEGHAQKQGLDLAAEWVEKTNPLDVKYGNAYDFSQDA